MPLRNPFVYAAVFGGILIASTLALSGHSRTSSTLSSVDPSRYAEIATTSEDGMSIATSTASLRLPILVYHIVRPAYPDDSQAVRKLALTPETFDAEMVYLARVGYHVISFDDLERYFSHQAALPQKPIIISFDDGWKDQFTYAFPLLQKNHYTATFFIFTNAVGRPGFVSWSDLLAMRDAGMTIGSHTKSHPFLTRTATSSLEAEIVDSKHILEQHLGVSVNEFAYPFGQYNPYIESLVKAAGYRSARGDFESGNQSAERRYELGALNAPTTIAAFEKKFPSTGYVGL